MTYKIALVDDDEAVRDSLEELLAAAGYLVTTFSTCSDFLRHLEEESPDALVLDHQMPGMTGVELAEHLKTAQRQPPIVMVSGNMSVQIRVRAMKTGVRQILHKPFSESELLDALDAIMQQPD